MMKTHFLLIFVMIQLVFGVQPVRFDVNRGPARRSLLMRPSGTLPSPDARAEFVPKDAVAWLRP